MGIPQIAVIVLYALSLGINMALNGKPRTGKNSFLASLITVGIMVTFLILGGFFK